MHVAMRGPATSKGNEAVTLSIAQEPLNHDRQYVAAHTRMRATAKPVRTIIVNDIGLMTCKSVNYASVGGLLQPVRIRAATPAELDDRSNVGGLWSGMMPADAKDAIPIRHHVVGSRS
jgi:hypothetical protein